jgi:hypothetical protein
MGKTKETFGTYMRDTDLYLMTASHQRHLHIQITDTKFLHTMIHVMIYDAYYFIFQEGAII